jgi:hypothetical protein
VVNEEGRNKHHRHGYGIDIAQGSVEKGGFGAGKNYDADQQGTHSGKRVN